MDINRCSYVINGLSPIDIDENDIRLHMPNILDILLMDRTSSSSRRIYNIIWANDNYIKYDPIAYAATAQIFPELITGDKSELIMPRVMKDVDLQKKRTKARAEVFTPTWVVKKQNDYLDAGYVADDLETYVRRKWLEIACGEAPYMATRYDMETGDTIPIHKRVGFVDRKLNRINSEVTDKAEWQRLVTHAFKSSFGFEWNGDSLLLARENLLYTYRDYYAFKWGELPSIPLSRKRARVQTYQLSFLEANQSEIDEWTVNPGKRVRIMNWDVNKMEYFDKGIKRS